jgi:hypothetical protein
MTYEHLPNNAVNTGARVGASPCMRPAARAGYCER